jgi:hypothetical protein
MAPHGAAWGAHRVRSAELATASSSVTRILRDSTWPVTADATDDVRV